MTDCIPADAVRELVDTLTMFVLAEMVPEFTEAVSEKQRAGGQAVWRKHRDEAIAALDALDSLIARARPCDEERLRRLLKYQIDVGEKQRIENEGLREALPDPNKLDLLADWFDQDDAHRGGPRGVEVQADLRRWAKAARTALAEEAR